MTYDLYKGYILTDGKVAKEKFKNKSSYRSLEDVLKAPSYAGVLNDDTILIDIDDKENANLFMDVVEDKQLGCKVIETTRGMHFLFRNNGVKTAMQGGSLACGISHVDVKIGTKASYEVLKIGEHQRTVIYDIYDDEEYDKLPLWAFPVKAREDFASMGEGDGRNEEIFKYVSYLQREELPVPAIKDAVMVLNDYVLRDPLPENEIQTLLREERFAKPVFFSKDGAFFFDKFARWLVETHNLVRMNGDIFTFDGKVYTNDKTVLRRQMIQEIPTLKKMQRSEVEAYLELIVNEQAENDVRYIAFKNGVYDLNTHTFGDFSPEKRVINLLNCNYDEGASSPVVDKALDDFACGDDSVRMLLEEIVGVCFYRRNELRKAFILVGDKMNGKSTFLSMVKKLIGWKNVTNLDLAELGDRFKTAELSGKLVNIGDDIEDEFIANSAVFKKLVAGNAMTVERKGQDPFNFTNYAKLLFSANNVPKIKDKTGAIATRLVLVPFNAHFDVTSEDFDLEIIDKLTTDESLAYLAQLGLAGLERVLKNREFSVGEQATSLMEEYQIDNDSVIGFVHDEGRESITNESLEDVYARYLVYCNSNGLKPYGKRNLSKQLKDKLGFESERRRVNGKLVTLIL